MGLVTMGNLASAIGSSQTSDIRLTQDMAEAPAGTEIKMSDFFVDEITGVGNDITCNWVVGENATFTLGYSGGASKFVQQILPVESNWEHQIVRGSSLVTFQSQNGNGVVYRADATGTFEIEMKFQDDFNGLTTSYNTWFSQTVTIASSAFNVNAYVSSDNDPTYTFYCQTGAGSPSFSWDLGNSAEYTIDSGSLSSQSLTVTFNINDPSKNIACTVSDPTCGSETDSFNISIDNAGAA